MDFDGPSLGDIAFNNMRDVRGEISRLTKLVESLSEDVERVTDALCYYHGTHFLREAECAMCFLSCKGHHGGQKRCPNFQRRVT